MRLKPNFIGFVTLIAASGCSDAAPDGDSQNGDGDAISGDGDEGSPPGDGDSGDGVSSTGGTLGMPGDGDGDSGTGGSGANGPGGLVPMFVGQGHLGRTLLSCDDGRTWIHDHSNDVGDGTCWSGTNEIECDHHEGAARGLTSGAGQFFAMFGWGTPSTLRRTADGASWELRIEASLDERYGGVAFLDGTLLAAGRYSRTSNDHGLTWSETIDTGMAGWNVRRAATAGDRFVIVGDSDDVVISADQGATWFVPDDLPSGCGANVQTRGGIAYGQGVIVIVGGDGVACYSSDGGVTFAQTSAGGAVASHLVWSGSEFVAYGEGNAYRSTDGASWNATEISPSLNLGPVAVSDVGTFVAVEEGWGDSAWYEGQEFYRSSDGLTWETLAPGTFTGGHPMRTIAFGYAEASEGCSAP